MDKEDPRVTEKKEIINGRGFPEDSPALRAQASPDRDPTQSTSTHRQHHQQSPRRHSHRRRAENLDEETLQRVRTYLESGVAVASLDENAIGNRMARTARAAQDEVRYRLDLSEDSEDEKERVYEKAHAMFEDQSIAQDFYKTVVSDTQRQATATLDKRTMTWLRKAIGLHKRTDFWEPHHQRHGHYNLGRLTLEDDDESGGSDNENGKPRRLTRGMARSSRIAKSKEREQRENMGLNALVSAVDELEEAMGPFEARPGRRRAKRKKSDIPEDSLITLDRSPSDYKKVLSPVPSSTVSGSKGLQRQTSAKSKPPPFLPDQPHSKKRSTPEGPIPQQSSRKKRRQPQVDEEEEDMSGYLLGPIDPTSIYKDDRNLRSLPKLAAPVSLTLLEWRRRQQWMPSIKNLPEVDVPRAFALSEINPGLPSWSATNPIPHLQRKPSTKEPPRRRHTDAVYASWCTRLINCLKGSGRSWAHHEFFYSDLDRAWFSSGEFKAEIAKLGVPPNARLTRSEWSLVRRRIAKRPRRFSRRFVQKQLDQLSAYRHTARWVQKFRRGRPPYFRFEVPAPIKVGSTVSAYNARYRIIHRGIVLAHDDERHGYVVMFERKELGFAFCPDIDVASHGAPDIIAHAADASLNRMSIISDLQPEPGTLPYGTSYGPVYGPEEGDHQTDSILSKLLTRESNMVGVQHMGDKLKRDICMINGMDRAAVEQVAERETLVRLAGVIADSLQRKSRILDAMEGFTSFYQDKVIGRAIATLQEHYSWLEANLQMTNRSLQSALTYLQVMYSNSYGGILSSLVDDDYRPEPTLDDDLLTLNEPSPLDIKFAPFWASQLDKASDRLADAVVKARIEWDSNSPIGKADNHRRSFLDQQLTAAYQLILSTDYCSGLLLGKDAQPNGLLPRARTVGSYLSAQGDKLSPKAIPSDWHCDIVSCTAEARESAFRDFETALAGLETEILALDAAKQAATANFGY